MEEEKNQDFLDKISEQLDKVKEIITLRHKQYNGCSSVFDYFLYGEVSYNQMLWLKILRELNSEGKPIQERDTDSLIDLISYALFKLLWIDEMKKVVGDNSKRFEK